MGVDSDKKDVLVLGKAIAQGLGDQTSAEKMYTVNFTKINTKFYLSLHYNGDTSYLFVNGTEVIKFKAKDSMIVPYSLCLGNISKDWSNDNMKKIGLKGSVYDFSTDYSAIVVDNIEDIHKYFMKKNGIL